MEYRTVCKWIFCISQGEYHAAGFNYTPYPPKPSEVAKLGKIFGLTKPHGLNIADDVIHAINAWPTYAEACGVAEHDVVRIGAVLKT